MSIEIPNYQLLKKIGAGAFAEVWLAEHRHNRRKAAIKILKGSMEAGGDEEQLFLREGEVLASFDQPNIVRIFDNAKVGDHAYLVMEYLAGGSLADRMNQRGIAVGEAIGHVVQIAAALDAAHERDIIHRDLKPANIMLRNETTPVLTDFGASRLVKRSTIHGKGGGVIGTPQYMSPEQIRGDPLDGRSDLYALGVLFHELLCGKVPFDGTVTEVVVQHLQAPAPPLPAELRVLQPIVDKLLAKDRNDRFASGAALAEALRRCFLDQDALRRLVLSTPNTAWSSQLLALGFQLDTQRRNEVRIAQGQALAAQPTASDDGFSTRPATLPDLQQAAAARARPAPPPLPMAPPALPVAAAYAPVPAMPVAAGTPIPALPTAANPSTAPVLRPGGADRSLRVLAWVMLGVSVSMGLTELNDVDTLVGALVLYFGVQGAWLWRVQQQTRRHGRAVLVVAAWLALAPTALALLGGMLLPQLAGGSLAPHYAQTLMPGAILAGIVIGCWVLTASHLRVGWAINGLLIVWSVLLGKDMAWANVPAGLTVLTLWGLLGWWADLRLPAARG